MRKTQKEMEGESENIWLILRFPNMAMASKTLIVEGICKDKPNPALLFPRASHVGDPNSLRVSKRVRGAEGNKACSVWKLHEVQGGNLVPKCMVWSQ